MYRKTIRHESVRLTYTSSETVKLPEEIQTATIVNCGGERLLNNCDLFGWAHGNDKNNP